MSALRILPLILLLLAALPVRAATTLLRDADMEQALQQIAAPILSAAGLGSSSVKILVIDDGSLNAFVTDPRHIFIHSGLLLRMGSARELQAVIAHEAAHIANGHITRRMSNMRNASNAAGLGMLLSAAAAAAGSSEVAAGLAIGSSSAAMRRLFSHTRAEEAAADAASVRYMIRAGANPKGAVEVLDIFRGQEALSAGRQDPYMRTHPLTRDRMRAVEGMIAGHTGLPDDATANYWFQRAQGKLSAFKRAPNWTLRRLDTSGSRDIALMREAVAWHRQSNLSKALRAIDGALAIRPGDGYFLDLKGQILLESRQFGAAVQIYQAAASRAPREALILGGLGRAYLAAGNPKGALNALEQARARDFRDARILRDLAVAYAQTGQPAMASVVTAERYALMGRMKDAELHAKRALGALPRGSSPWQRADDVLIAAKRAK